MARQWRIKKGDRVSVISGKEKGKVGEILSVLRDEERVVVKGINMVTRHTRQTPTQPGGLVRKEASIHVSNVMHVDPKTEKPTRVGVKFLENGKKVRYAKASGEAIDK